MTSAFTDHSHIELDELHTSAQTPIDQPMRMPKGTRRPSEESLKSDTPVTIRPAGIQEHGWMENQQNPDHGRKNFLIGILLLLLVVLLWTSSNFITQVRLPDLLFLYPCLYKANCSIAAGFIRRGIRQTFPGNLSQYLVIRFVPSPAVISLLERKSKAARPFL